MHILRARGVEGADAARGSVAVIDVLRAFTTAAFAFDAGAREIVVTSSVDEAFALRERFSRALLVGEVAGQPIAGFDCGNSPDEVRARDLDDRVVILRSSSGTQGVVRARAAEATYLASLVVATATARALQRSPQPITLLAMGSPYGKGGSGDGAEDDACGDLLESLLWSSARSSMRDRGEIHARLDDEARTNVDLDSIRSRVRASDAASQALDPSIDWISPADLERALEIDRFDFAMRARRENGLWIARSETIARG
jgi:2-phosphosulfolactate phosphatase